MQRIAVIVALLLVAYVVWLYGWRRPTGGLPASPVVVSDEPVQEALDKPITMHVERGKKKFVLELTHRFEISGRVLSAEHYNVTWTNDFFDVDLGLVWGPRIEDLLERFHFHQDGRWLFWRSSEPVSDEDRAYVNAHSGNEHLIPKEGSRRVDHAIRWVEKGDTVRISGHLVVIRNSAWQELARSSTSRDDTGGGACEIVYVEEIQIGKTVYR